MSTSTRTATGALLLALSGLLAGCGGDAVATSASLDGLGEKMSAPAGRTLSLVRGSAADAEDAVTEDGSKDVACEGGKRREYAARVTGSLASGQDEKSLRNLVSLSAQAALKDAGVKVTTDLGKDASTVPAELDFSNDPSDPAQQRRYHTVVDVDGSTWTWRITGRTACVTPK